MHGSNNWAANVSVKEQLVSKSKVVGTRNIKRLPVKVIFTEIVGPTLHEDIPVSFEVALILCLFHSACSLEDHTLLIAVFSA